jgi:hypothetical protein
MKIRGLHRKQRNKNYAGRSGTNKRKSKYGTKIKCGRNGEYDRTEEH